MAKELGTISYMSVNNVEARLELKRTRHVTDTDIQIFQILFELRDGLTHELLGPDTIKDMGVNELEFLGTCAERNLNACAIVGDQWAGVGLT